ncbi:hypothetical protein [Pseudomonas monteilii]|uniref:hypothetical protein n=1 Tax=Pseudomonas monteilii TaxID=76759 RepID=UPI0015FAF3E3|nr:hypothetical protein [Pseudomonas monteilii]MBA6106009.1 hypothetical protein [Pseudomonas monteilii]
MREPDQLQRSVADIIEGKRFRREALMQAVASANSGELEASAERIKAVMRKPAGAENRRQRMAPPAFLAQS